MPCTYCQKGIANKGSLKSHELRCPLNPDRTAPIMPNRRGIEPWNKGLTKETSAAVAEIARKVSKATAGRKGKPHTEETKARLREVALERNLGGYQEKAGRGKKGKYRNIWCDSSWELAFVIKCFEEGKDIKRCTEKRKYVFEGKDKCYHPDFIVNGNIYEIKGWKTKEWGAKHIHNPDVIVIGHEEIKDYLEYARAKYGSDFTHLYEEKCFNTKGGLKEPVDLERVRLEKLKAKLDLVRGVDFGSCDWPEVCAELLNVSEKTSKAFIRKHLSEYPLAAKKLKKPLPEEVIALRIKLLSEIDLLKFGWVSKASKALGMSHTSVKRFVDKYYQGDVFRKKPSTFHGRSNR